MWETIKNWAMTQGLELGTNILVAVIILVIGILICKLIMKIVDAALKKSKMDPAAHALIKTLTKSIIYRNQRSFKMFFSLIIILLYHEVRRLSCQKIRARNR